jgi:hypothetical protein
MNINLLPFVVIWALLALVVLALYFKHRSLARQEDASLDVLESAAVAQQHLTLEHKLEGVDKWGKTLTVIVVIYGLVLAGLYLYQTWVQGSTAGL